MRRRVRLSAAEARRVALAAQDLHRDRPASAPDARHFRRAMQALKVLQLDFVNVLVPAHYLILWSRLGAYDRQRFDRFVYRSGDYTEQLAHEASIVPIDAWPLLAHRRAAYEPSKNNPLRKLRGRENYLAAVLEQVRDDGALTSADLPPLPGPKRRPGDWHRSIPRWALEYHFARGDLAVAQRLGNFQRVYDLPERLIPRDHLEASLHKAAADRELLRRAAVQPNTAAEPVLGPYLTISREAGSRGADVARRVGRSLGWSVLDRELVQDLAERVGLEPRLLELMDETRINWFSETLLNLFSSRLLLQDSFVSMLSRSMALAAFERPVVIVGRAGNLVLTPDRGLRVRIVAPREMRVAVLLDREGLDLRSAGRHLDRLDAGRVDFVRRHFHCDPTDPGLYDLVVNVIAFGVDGTAELICHALEVRGLLN